MTYAFEDLSQGLFRITSGVLVTIDKYSSLSSDECVINWDEYREDESNMSKKAVAEKMLEHWANVLTELSKYPEQDPCEDGDVIRFAKTFKDGIRYRYAAIRTGGLWYTTGLRRPKAYSWQELIEWMGSGVGEIWLMRDERRLAPVVVTHDD